MSEKTCPCNLFRRYGICWHVGGYDPRKPIADQAKKRQHV